MRVNLFRSAWSAVFAAFIVAACNLAVAAGMDAAVAPSTAVSVSGAVNKPLRLDLAALQALPPVTQALGGSSYTGASLWTLLNTVAGIKSEPGAKNASISMYVVVTGADGYKAVLSLAEIDPAFGNRSVLVAYSVNGADLGHNGMARLIVPGEVKMGRSVSALVGIEVFAVPKAP